MAWWLEWRSYGAEWDKTVRKIINYNLVYKSYMEHIFVIDQLVQKEMCILFLVYLLNILNYKIARKVIIS